MKEPKIPSACKGSTLTLTNMRRFWLAQYQHLDLATFSMLFPRLQLQDGSAAELLEIIMMTEATTERQIKRSTDLEEAFMGVVELAVRLAPDHGTLDHVSRLIRRGVQFQLFRVLAKARGKWKCNARRMWLFGVYCTDVFPSPLGCSNFFAFFFFIILFPSLHWIENFKTIVGKLAGGMSQSLRSQLSKPLILYNYPASVLRTSRRGLGVRPLTSIMCAAAVPCFRTKETWNNSAPAGMRNCKRCLAHDWGKSLLEPLSS